MRRCVEAQLALIVAHSEHPALAASPNRLEGLISWADTTFAGTVNLPGRVTGYRRLAVGFRFTANPCYRFPPRPSVIAVASLHD